MNIYICFMRQLPERLLCNFLLNLPVLKTGLEISSGNRPESQVGKHNAQAASPKILTAKLVFEKEEMKGPKMAFLKREYLDFLFLEEYCLFLHYIFLKGRHAFNSSVGKNVVG